MSAATTATALDLLSQEIAEGGGLTLSQAAERFPPFRQGRPVTPSCLARWILQGVRGPNGSRVKLEAARLAGRHLTSSQAIIRFIAAQQDTAPDSAPPSPRTPGKRQRDAERAGEELSKIGI